ncbi:MAG: ROK family protein [Acidimicrobiia bacterium]|nr:ROK family protein [Acidimicrobiia bacterium]
MSGPRVSRLLGIDFGGTNVKAVVVEDRPGADPTVVGSGAVPTRADEGPAVVIEQIIAAGRSLLARHGPVDAAGLGTPGAFDPAEGTIVMFPNFPGDWVNRPLRQPVAEALGLPVTMINDARALTLAEGTIGAGKGCGTIVCLTLGTGIGGGVMIDGKLVLGAEGRAGEVGHQIIEPDGPQCGCGNRGCVEALTKADVLASLAGRETVEEVYRAAAQGDPRSIDAIERVASYLGIALANMVTVLGPDRIIIGGGIMSSGEQVLGPIRRAVSRRVTWVPPETVSIVPAELGTMGGAIGAALAARG